MTEDLEPLVITSDPLPVSDNSHSNDTDDVTPTAVKLERNVGLWSGVGIILGIVVGSGIFVSPVGVMEYSGSVGEALIVWFACGIFSTMGALCYAELGVALPSSGGDYTYIYEIFGPFWAFMRIWIEVIVIRPVAHAIIALTLAEYALQPIFPTSYETPEGSTRLIAVLSIGFLTWLNCQSSKLAIRMQNVFSAAKVLALLLVIVCGILQIVKGNVENFSSENLFRGSIIKPGQISLSIYAGLWAFSGWNELNYVIEEMKNPSKHLPLAIIISILTTTVLYLAVNISYLTVLTPEEMLRTPATASVFGKLVLGRYHWIIPLSVALCCFGGINGSLFTSSRLFYVGSRNKHLPSILAMINIKRLTPTPSIIFIGVTSSLYLITDDVYALINYSNFVYFFAIGFAIVGLLIIRWKGTVKNNTFKAPIIFPIISIIVCFGTGILSFIKAPLESGIGVALVLSSIPAYLIFISAQKPKWAIKVHDKLTLWLQLLTESVPEETTKDA